MTPEAETRVQDLRMFVLDILCEYGNEQLWEVLELLNQRDGVGWRAHWPRDFERGQVVQALQHLIDDGMVSVENRSTGSVGGPVEPVDEGWFAATSRGRDVRENWDPPPERA